MRNMGKITAFLLVSVMLLLCFSRAYNTEASDIFTDSKEELFIDSADIENSASPDIAEAEFIFCEEIPPEPEEAEIETDIELETGEAADLHATLEQEEEIPVSLAYEDRDIKVIVTEKESGIFAEDSILTVIPVKNTEEPYIKLWEKLAENMPEGTNGILDMKLYDFVIKDADGNALKPDGGFHVTISYKTSEALAETDTQEAPETEVKIICPAADPDTGELIINEPVLDEQGVKLELTDDGVLWSVDLEMDELGTIALVWPNVDNSITQLTDSAVPTGGDMPDDAEFEALDESEELELIPMELELTALDEDLPVAWEGEEDTVHESILKKEYLDIADNESNAWQIVSGRYINDDTLPTITDDKMFRYQKSIIPTKVENEFLVYLNVEPRMDYLTSWFAHGDIWVVNNNIDATQTFSFPCKNNPAPKELVAAGKASHFTISNTGRLCDNPDDSKLDTNTNHASQTPTHITSVMLKDSDGNPLGTIPTDLYYSVSQKSDGSFGIVAGHAEEGSTTTTYYSFGNVSCTNGILSIPLGGWLGIPDPPTNTSEYRATALPTVIEDPMGSDFIEFKKVIDSTADTTWSFDSNTLRWNFPTEITSEGELVGDSNIQKYLKNRFELLYRIRLKTELTGFKSSYLQPPESIYATNNNAILTYKRPITDGANNDYGQTAIIDQPLISPQVRGLLYDIELKKENDLKEPLANAEFTLTGTTGADQNITTLFSESFPDGIKAISDSNGILKFRNLPWGNYMVAETAPPAGYETEAPSPSIDYSLCYTANPTGYTQDSAPDNNNVISNGDPNVIKNPRPRVSHMVEKIWVGTPEEDLDVELKAYINFGAENQRELLPAEYAPSDLTGEFGKQTLSANEADTDLNWKYHWENLLKYYYFTEEDGTPNALPITYTVTELLPTDIASKYTVSITESADGMTTTITNSPAYELPSTGGNGIFRYVAGGVVLMLASVFLLYKDRLKRVLKS